MRRTRKRTKSLIFFTEEDRLKSRILHIARISGTIPQNEAPRAKPEKEHSAPEILCMSPRVFATSSNAQLIKYMSCLLMKLEDIMEKYDFDIFIYKIVENIGIGNQIRVYMENNNELIHVSVDKVCLYL